MFEIQILTPWNTNSGNILQVILDYPAEWTDIASQVEVTPGMMGLAIGRVTGEMLDLIQKDSSGNHCIISAIEIIDDSALNDPEKPIEVIPKDVKILSGKEPVADDDKTRIEEYLAAKGITGLLLRTDEDHVYNINILKEALNPVNEIGVISIDPIKTIK